MYLLVDKLHLTVADEYHSKGEAIQNLTLDTDVELFEKYVIMETDDEGNIVQSFIEDDLIEWLERK